MIGKTWCPLLVFAACAAAGGAPNVHAEQSPGEYQIKAAFLYNFVKFVNWPAEASATRGDRITLCVLGDDPFGAALESINGKSVRGRKMAIKRFESLKDLEFCHILFIGSSEKERLAQIFESVDGWSVLTVGETERFTQLGGIINFIIKGNKIRFEINARAAEQAGLKISSRLLRLAEVVAS